MKSTIKTIAWLGVLGLLVMAVVVDVAQAQQQGGRGSQTALILCDVLVLDQGITEKVVAVYGEVRQQLRDQQQNAGVSFQDMSDEERTKYFEKRQKDTAEALNKALKDVLSEKELGVVEAILAKRIFTPDAELRALRPLDLKDEQRKQIQPLAIELSKAMVPGSSRFFGAQMDETEREKAEKAYQEKKTAFVAKVKEILSSEQNTAWQEKTAEEQKAIDEMIEQRRNAQRQ